MINALVRPVRREDIENLMTLARHTLTGLTTLPPDEKILNEKITESCRNFEYFPDKPGGEIFLFVMEDVALKKIVGVCSCVTKVGGFKPFYTYKIKKVLKHSKALSVRNTIEYLQLKTSHDGPSEIGTLFLLPEYRGKGVGRLLSLSRFLFIAEYKHIFEKNILAELRGVFDSRGHSAFWDTVGKHFFKVDFERADLMVMKDKTFIEELMPKHPIYIPLLPENVQKLIGKEDEKTQPARKLLESEGFKFKDEVDIFEAGPVLGCPINRIRTVKNSKKAAYKEKEDCAYSGEKHLIANVSAPDKFCVTIGKVAQVDSASICCDRQSAKALNLDRGNRLRYVKLKG